MVSKEIRSENVPKMQSPDKEIKVSLHENTLDAIMSFYAKGFQPNDGEEIVKYDYLHDVKRGKVLFRITSKTVDGLKIVTA